MDLSEAEDLAKRLISSHLGPTWSFRWDHAKTRLGACHHHTRTISLSRHYVRLNGVAETTDTILHEIAHALTPGTGHGPAWKKMASRLGARPSTRADPRSVVHPAPRWVAVCAICATTLRRYRRPTTAMACARCCRRYNGGRFDPSFLLRWSLVDPTTAEDVSPVVVERADRPNPGRRVAARSAWKAPLERPAQLDLFTEPP
ncbi:MAG: SprT-like domain-containing protein [Acidimicrobiaceae bacterium]|nr:SprT-like domain-containing protein [Acidimicrobiaceae bacterium]